MRSVGVAGNLKGFQPHVIGRVQCRKRMVFTSGQLPAGCKEWDRGKDTANLETEQYTADGAVVGAPDRLKGSPLAVVCYGPNKPMVPTAPTSLTHYSPVPLRRHIGQPLDSHPTRWSARPEGGGKDTW